MSTHPRPARPVGVCSCAILFLLLAGLFAAVNAQEASSRREAESVTAEEVSLGLAEAKAAELDEEVLAQVENIYGQASKDLSQLKELAKQQKEFQLDTTTAAEDMDKAKRMLDEQPDALAALELREKATVDQLDAKLRTLDARLKAARKNQEALAAEPARRQRRMDQLPEELADAEQRLETLKEQLEVPAIAGEPDELTKARRIGTRAAIQVTEQRLQKLNAEQEMYLATADLLRIRQQLEAREVKLLTGQVEKLQARLSETREKEIKELSDETTAEAKKTFVELKPYADVNVELSERLEKLAKDASRAQKAAMNAEEENKKLETDLAKAKERVSDAKLSETVGVILRQEKVELLTRRHSFRHDDTLKDAVRMRGDRYQLKDMRDDVSDPAAFAESTLEKMAKGNEENIDEARKKMLREPLTDIYESRRDLLDRLIAIYNDLIRSLESLESQQRSYAKTSREYTTLIDEHILWIRSGPPVGYGEPGAWGESLEWLMSPENWRAVGGSFGRALRQQLPMALPWLAIAALTIGAHPVTSKRIFAAGLVAEKRSCRDFRPTFTTLIRTIFKSIMWPSVLYVLGRLISLGQDGNPFSQSLAIALTQVALIIVPFELLRQTCRGKGLADAHSEWLTSSCKTIKRQLDWFLPTATVLLLAMLTLQNFGEDAWNQTLGRAILVALLTVSAFLLYGLIRPLTTFFRRSNESGGGSAGWFVKLGFLRWVLLPGVPVVLLVFALAGYNYTAIELGLVWIETLAVGIGLFITYLVALRFLLVRRRRLRYEQLIEQREQQRKAAEEAADSSVDVKTAAALPIELKTEAGLDITDVSRQAREMTAVLFGLIAVLICWNIWQDLLPATRIFDEWRLWQSATGENGEALQWVTFRDLLASLLLFGLTFLGVRNIPGLLELLLLKQLPLDSGSRYAISTIVRYIITVVGVVLALGFLKVSWTKYSWLVAAISVGLGFGLQEIVANFVSGLILLLERPVRVGDVVTIDGTTGVVSRIKMRATTVTNWDNQELVVPNKDLITGKLMNWTLSSVVNRISIGVGVAYGSDPNVVREILLNVAKQNADILDDPEPMVSFEAFGDSSLNFKIRCCITAISRRYIILHDVNTAIYNELTAAEISIPFPQRDLNFKVPDGFELTMKKDA